MIALHLLSAAAAVIGLAAMVASQVILFRVRRRLLKSIVAGFAIGLAATVVATLVSASHHSRLDLAARLFLNACVFAALSYGYFNFLNLGETARRVRILREFVEAGGTLTLAELQGRYNARQIVEIRLARLLSTGQVRRQGENFVTGKTSVLRMAQLLVWMKRLLLGRPSEFQDAAIVGHGAPASKIVARDGDAA